MIGKFFNGFLGFLSNLQLINTTKFIATLIFIILLFILRNTIIYLERKF